MSISQLYYGLGLSGHSKNIRILDLHPLCSSPNSGSEPPLLEGTLRVINLAYSTDFTALSYVWGEETSDDPIIRIGGYDVSITKNCYDALICIRAQFGRIQIWVDKICIDQNCLAERSHQVNLMGDIYRHASTMFAWLGTNPTDTKALIWLGQVSGRLTTWDSRSREEITYLQGLLGNDWFRRGWTFQELILARNPVLLTSEYQLSWLEFSDAVVRGLRQKPGSGPGSITRSITIPLHNELAQLVQTWRASLHSTYSQAMCARIFTKSTEVVEILVESYFFALIWSCLSSVKSLFGLLLSSNLVLVLCAHSLYGIGNVLMLSFQSRGKAFSLSRLYLVYLGHILLFSREIFVVRALWAFLDACALAFARVACYGNVLDWTLLLRLGIEAWHNRVCSSTSIIQAIRTRHVRNPKDKFYAYYGVLRSLGADLPVSDYAKSKDHISYDFFTTLLRWRSSSLATLVDAGNTDPGFTPSWVPLLDAPDQRSQVKNKIVFLGTEDTLYTRLYHCGLPLYRINGSSLTVYGRCLGTVSYFIQLPTFYQQDTKLDCLHAILSWHWNRQHYGDHYKRNVRSVESFMSYIFRLLYNLLHVFGLKDTETTHLLLCSILNGQIEEFLPNTQDETSRMDPIHAQQILTELESSLACYTFDRLGVMICGKRSLFITQEGHIGVGPFWMQSGDSIFRITGVPLPMVLRKQESQKTYRVIGPASTSGIEPGISWLRCLEKIVLI